MANKGICSWFQFADHDLDAAEVLLEYRPQRYEIICYHSQQAVEKYLKAYLLYKGLEVLPKIHDLVDLNKRCSAFDPEFENILDECEALSQYGVQPRYPDEIYLDEELMKQAISYARKIKNFMPLQAARKRLEQS